MSFIFNVLCDGKKPPLVIKIRNDAPKQTTWYYFRQEHQPFNVHSAYIQQMIENHIEIKKSKGRNLSSFNVKIYLDQTLVSEYVREGQFCFLGQLLFLHSLTFTKEELRAIHRLKFDHLRDDAYQFIQQFKQVFKKLDLNSDKTGLKTRFVLYVHQDDKIEFRRKLAQSSLDELYQTFYQMAASRKIAIK